LAILEKDEKIDLLFTDITLMDEHEAGLGLGLVFTEKPAGLPVLYTTGGITDGMVALFVQPNAFLAKPYTGEQLLIAVSNLLPARS
jgi:DNA-binding NtrC family response regulator